MAADPFASSAVADGYVGCIDRIVEHALRHDAGTALPMCPGWSIRDLLGHLCGLAEDWADGNLDAYASGRWTAAQVDRHRTASLEAVCDELRRGARTLVTLPPHAVMGAAPRWAYGDALVHEADVCETLGLEPTVPSDDVNRHLGAGLARWELGRHSVRLEVRSPERSVIVGAAHTDEGVVAASVAASSYELWRFIYGRRSRSEIETFAWKGDVDAVLACGLPYPFRIPDHG
ncbi:MAG: maleylpyruvate isomerase family mycothiol-dependent enzyme [Actinomycetota bacterium]